jgi:GNAT acetyltransferase-like protein
MIVPPGERLMAMQAMRTHFHLVVSPQPVEFLVREIDGLPAEQTLVNSGAYAIIQARGPQIPRLLEEIGRLREISFRDAGEGTGKAVDLDQFDETYTHLFTWNRARRNWWAHTGSHLADEIVNEHGLPGLSTHSLFEYGQTLLDRLGPAVELGRSFVRPEYQRDFQPLMLLWKGISRLRGSHFISAAASAALRRKRLKFTGI